MSAIEKVWVVKNHQGLTIQNVGTPVNDTDVATKASAAAQAAAAQAAAIAAAASDATTKADAAVVTSNTYTDGKISALVNGATEAYDTLGEIGAILSNGTSGTAALLTAIGLKTGKFVGTISGSPTAVAGAYEYTLTHALDKANVIVQAYEGNDVVDVKITKVDNNNVKIITGVALGSTVLTIVVVG